jgi:hypothetical protein
MLAGLHYLALQAGNVDVEKYRATGTMTLLVIVAIGVFMIASMWKVFEKAGEPGWASIIPIYNAIVLLRIAGKPFWWLILIMIPLVNFAVMIIIGVALAERFGKGVGFGLGLTFLSPIFYPILAFGDAEYSRA